MRIGRTEVRAPVAGIVSRRSARARRRPPRWPASRCSASSRTARSTSKPRCRSNGCRGSKVGMPATLKLPGVEAPVAGKVRLVDQEVDKASRTGKVRIALADVSHARIGAFASGEVDLVAPRRRRRAGHGAAARRRRRRALLVVQGRRGRGAQGQARHRRGRRGRDRDGVAAGETLVARAAAFLRPGDRVRPMPRRRRRRLRTSHASQRLRLVDPQADPGDRRCSAC